jgi:hypothetical protein
MKISCLCLIENTHAQIQTLDLVCIDHVLFSYLSSIYWSGKETEHDDKACVYLRRVHETHQYLQIMIFCSHVHSKSRFWMNAKKITGQFLLIRISNLFGNGNRMEINFGGQNSP